MSADHCNFSIGSLYGKSNYIYKSISEILNVKGERVQAYLLKDSGGLKG